MSDTSDTKVRLDGKIVDLRKYGLSERVCKQIISNKTRLQVFLFAATGNLYESTTK